MSGAVHRFVTGRHSDVRWSCRHLRIGRRRQQSMQGQAHYKESRRDHSRNAALAAEMHENKIAYFAILAMPQSAAPAEI
jgi:hypothetical protein